MSQLKVDHAIVSHQVSSSHTIEGVLGIISAHSTYRRLWTSAHEDPTVVFGDYIHIFERSCKHGTALEATKNQVRLVLVQFQFEIIQR